MSKKLITLLLGLALLVPVTMSVTSCGTTPARTALTATGVQVATVDTAMQAWADYVKAGLASQAQVDAVKNAYIHYYQAGLAEKAAWIAYANAPTNATPAQVAGTVASGAKNELINLVLGFLPADRVALLMKGQ